MLLRATVTTRMSTNANRLRRGWDFCSSKPPPTRCAGRSGKVQKGKTFFSSSHRPAFRPPSTPQKSPGRKGKPDRKAAQLTSREGGSASAGRRKARPTRKRRRKPRHQPSRTVEKHRETSHGEARHPRHRRPHPPTPSARAIIESSVQFDDCLAAGRGAALPKIKQPER